MSRRWRRRALTAIALAGAAVAAAAGLTVAPAAVARTVTPALAARAVAPVAAARAAAPAAAATCEGQPAPWMNRQLPPGQRARLLVSAMTLDQEVQMTASVSTATESREVPAIPALCIPALLLTNGSAGISTGGPVQEPATALPAPISLASTWSPAAASQYGQVEGTEALDQGRNDVEGPDINIARVPVNGRTFEAYGEDPYLAGQIAAGDVTGIQSRGVIATVKHYAANNQETSRTTINELIDQRTLHEIYLPAFQAAVQAGVGSVMCAKNLVNGTHACDSADLIGVLEKDWHFPGFVVSDFSSIHDTVQAADAGTSLELPSASYFGSALAAAVQAGQVSKATVDDMVERIFFTMFRLGLFDRPAPIPAPIPAGSDAAAARSLAEAGTVLLKNDSAALPLDPGRLQSIALIGPEAGTASTGGAGSPKVAPIRTVSPLQAIGAAAARHHIAVNFAGAPPVNLGPDAIPSYALTPAGGTPGQHGLLAQYFDNSNWQGTPAVSRVEPYIDENALPPAGVNSGQTYSVRWTGTLTPTVSGPYTLSVTTHSASTLYLSGQKLASDGGSFPAQTAGQTVSLTAGTPYAIRVDYRTSGMAVAELSWQPPAGAGNPLIDQAVSAAKASDVAVVFAGDQESEGVDRPDLSLPGFQDQLIEAVARANPRTIVVLNTGGPVLMPWLSQVPAVLEAWYPGEEDGSAIAAMLFGDADPAGKLPITFPASGSAVPASTPAQYPGIDGTAVYSEGLDVGYRYDDAAGITPLFPFGYGLSYTTFGFSHLAVAGPAGPGGTVRVDAQVTNTGQRAGTEVAQLYIGDPAAAGEPPRQLRGFQRVTLQPGQHQVVHFTLPASALAYWDTASQGWATAPGTYQVYVGDSSALAGLPLQGEFSLGEG
ncbi:MAG TPA: glycoside hydrolase family 3 C-terminal domain-containing protein [Streptosporangiaceae bacterium]|nr:glycoside hydrolase family 3 C-terminal domain-containing protein [Streptosporangiaceae bacterium]